MRKPIVPKQIELNYSKQLRHVAKTVGTIINQHLIVKREDGEITEVSLQEGLSTILKHYSSSLDPWAKHIAETMVNHVDRSNKKYMLTVAPQISKQLKSDYAISAVGLVAKDIVNDQVTLIKSLPLEAAERAQNLAREAATGGRRASDIADMIMASGDVTKSRADLIARTEIHKSWSALTQSRSQYVGANQYIWRTAGDEIVRESHAEMDGQVCDFNAPPTLSDGMTGNAGEFPNCRCYAEPIISDQEE